jgi:eukaryotic-like serine/threonine-protein kinase
VGRAEPLAALGEALADTRAGQAVAVHVRGRSGMGKSVLCHHFLDGLNSVLVLRARCYERDSVPFKALDPLVDQLSRWISALPTADAAALLPRYVRSLARLFPVLQQVPAIAESGQRTAPAADPREERRRAFGALRELLARVSERETVVVHLDDLQWGDQDSGELLRELLRRPDPPSMLLIASFRVENEETSPLLRLLRRNAVEEGVRTIDIEPLDRDLSLQLARQILQERDIAPDQLDAAAAQIAQEGAGSPFFVTELAHWGGGGGAKLDGLVRARAGELPNAVGRLLQTIALVAVPVARRVALDAAGIAERRTESMTVLENGRFIRGDGPGLDDPVECYHDRIREAVADGMEEAARRQTHVAIARALEAASSDDAELLTEHWLLAGHNSDAARHARVAVDQALDALAFDRAAAMLRLLLELGAPDESERRTLLERLGGALTHAGRSLEAADVFEQAATLAGGSARRTLLSEVAVLRLGAGQFDRGRALFYELLDAVQIRVPRSRVALILGALWARLRTRIRGLRFDEREDDEVPTEERERLDLIRGAGVGTITTDQFLAFNLLARFIPWALNRGTRSQQVWALTAESFVAQIEPGGRKRGDAAFAAAEALAERIGNSEALATACMYRGVALVQLGFIKAALVSVRRAARLLEDHVAGGTSNLGWARMFLVGGLGQEGRVAECMRQTSELVEDARNRGDLALEIHVLVGNLVIPDLLLDRPDAAGRMIDDALSRWDRSVEEFDLMHFYGLMCRTRVSLYGGESEAPGRLLTQHRKDIRRSGALQSGANIRYYRSMEGASAIAAARVAPPRERTRLLRRADKLAELLLGHGPMGEGTGGILGAGPAVALGRPDVARARLDLAERVSTEQDMGLFAASARIHRAHLFGDGTQLQAAYDELGALGVRDPVRWTQSMVPLLDVPPVGNDRG